MCCILLVGSWSYWLSDHSDGVVSHTVTCVDTGTVHQWIIYMYVYYISHAIDYTMQTRKPLVSLASMAITIIPYITEDAYICINNISLYIRNI